MEAKPNGKGWIIPASDSARSGANGDDNFDWMDHWKILNGAVIPEATDESPPKPKNDYLLLQKTDSASAIIYWNGSKFVWYQQGD